MLHEIMEFQYCEITIYIFSRWIVVSNGAYPTYFYSWQNTFLYNIIALGVNNPKIVFALARIYETQA